MALFTPRVTFDLVAESGSITPSPETWSKIQYQLLEFQPASKIRLLGDPTDRIRVWAFGREIDVAPNLLSRVEELIGTSLRVEAVS